MRLQGSFAPPGDKSISHRLGLLALLAEGVSSVKNYSPCADCASTLAAAEQLGVGVKRQANAVELSGAGGRLKPGQIDCGNSGTTMRLLMGILAGRPGEFTLIGDESLSRRPMQRVADPLNAMGANVRCNEGKPPININGAELHGAKHVLVVASAQLKSALLLAGIQADGETWVSEPSLSRDHTERLFGAWGADIGNIDGGWRVKRSSLKLPPSLSVPGDASSAAFFICGAMITPGSRIEAKECLLNPTRIGFLEVLKRMGADLEIIAQGSDPEPWGKVQTAFSPDLRGCHVQGSEIPLLVDEVPILALAATQAKGETVFHEVGELRIKESDRLGAIVSQLSTMGADLEVKGDDLVVRGPAKLQVPERELESFGDHRIAMTLAMAGVAAGRLALIKDAACAAISYPGFIDDLEGLLA
jgi:3-phosphoshikimate 1-carboxyvinyltransferase